MLTPAGELPMNFRSMYGLSVVGNRASGSAQYSPAQLRNLQATGAVQTPMVMVDLRQEPYGFLHVSPAVLGEDHAAIGWFAERDWFNVAKGLPSIEVDEINRLQTASQAATLTVYQVCTKTAEDGIATAVPLTVTPAVDFYSEQGLLASMFSGATYLRLPTTDHCRPRDEDVQQFVSFDANVPANTWLPLPLPRRRWPHPYLHGDARHHPQRARRLTGGNSGASKETGRRGPLEHIDEPDQFRIPVCS